MESIPTQPILMIREREGESALDRRLLGVKTSVETSYLDGVRVPTAGRLDPRQTGWKVQRGKRCQVGNLLHDRIGQNDRFIKDCATMNDPMGDGDHPRRAQNLGQRICNRGKRFGVIGGLQVIGHAGAVFCLDRKLRLRTADPV